MGNRFKLDYSEEKEYINFLDTHGSLIISKNFEINDEEWLVDLIDFLNDNELFLRDTSFKYIELIHEINTLKKNIINTLTDELNDCELLMEVDNEDLYTQGRLVELHNLMKILL